MKRVSLLTILLWSFNQIESQITIKITTVKDSTIIISSNFSNDKEKNFLVINNTFDQDKCKVFLRSSTSVSNFKFGKGGKSLPKGLNRFEFNSQGIIKDYGDNRQMLKIPFELSIFEIKDNNDSSLIRREKIDTTTVGADLVVNKSDLINPPGNSEDVLTAIPYYDAFQLLNYTEIGQDQFEKILKYYANDPELTSADLGNAYKDNVFLKTLFDKARFPPTLAPSPIENIMGKGLSSVGGLDVTNIADAFANFIVKRTKQELNIAFFDKFKKIICDTNYKDLQTVFPQTFRSLTIIGDEIYNYESYIQTLRESFENDLSSIEKNLPTIIENHPAFFYEHPELAATLNSSCYIAGALEDKVHPGDILKDYPAYYLDPLNKNWKGAIQTLQLFSASLRDTAANKDLSYWVSAKQVKTLLNNNTAFQIYLGLIYQEAKNHFDSIHFNFAGTDQTLIEYFNKHGADLIKDLSSFKDFTAQLSEKADKLNMMIKNNIRPTGDSLAYEQYYQYFNASIDLIQHSTKLSNLKYIRDVIPNLSDSLKDYFDALHSTADLVLDIKRRKYSSAVVNAVHVYDLVKAKYTVKRGSKKDSLSQRQVRRSKRKVNMAVAENLIKRAENDPAFVLTRAAIDSLRNNQFNDLKIKRSTIISKFEDDTLKKLYKYGTFMATIVQAKSSDDIEKAIEAFALPTGSSRIKRVSEFNVSLNIYAGLFGGMERIRNVDSGKVRINSFGVAAPIGVAASWGHRLFWIPTKSEWSTSLFFSLIDLGAVAAYRFRDDSTANVPTIHLKDIFSPGVFISSGIPRTPLSINLGVQVGPNLRKIGDGNNDFSNKTYVRYSASFCVDIPILNFYTKSR